MGIWLFGRKKSADTTSITADLDFAKKTLGGRLRGLFSKGSSLDEDSFEEIEDILLGADVGVDATTSLLTQLRADNAKSPFTSRDDLRQALTRAILGKTKEYELRLDNDRLNVLLMMGVNGVGKTTTIGKLAWMFKQEGVSLVLAACDTFRAAAVKQLSLWAEKVAVPLVCEERENADPGSVLYRAVDEAFATGAQLLIVDTAGRMHTKANLMQEMEKLSRILKRKAEEGALLAQNLLVLDANTGQNALEQAKKFHEAARVDGVVLTKMDSSAKGGVALALGSQMGLPIAFLGTGEKIDAIQPFDAQSFIETILS